MSESKPIITKEKGEEIAAAVQVKIDELKEYGIHLEVDQILNDNDNFIIILKLENYHE